MGYNTITYISNWEGSTANNSSWTTSSSSIGTIPQYQYVPFDPWTLVDSMLIFYSDGERVSMNEITRKRMGVKDFDYIVNSARGHKNPGLSSMGTMRFIAAVFLTEGMLFEVITRIELYGK